MGHSYRQDQSDSVYSSAGGPSIVAGSRQTTTPGAASGAASGDVEQFQIVGDPLTVYTADGAIAVSAGTAVISKAGSAAAMTLAAPTALQNGIEIVLISGTAYAHVITATGLIDDGVTGGAKNTVTLGAFVGATAVLKAYNLHWVLKSKTVATVA